MPDLEYLVIVRRQRIVQSKLSRTGYVKQSDIVQSKLSRTGYVKQSDIVQSRLSWTIKITSG
jgi:hypothetical protein